MGELPLGLLVPWIFGSFLALFPWPCPHHPILTYRLGHHSLLHRAQALLSHESNFPLFFNGVNELQWPPIFFLCHVVSLAFQWNPVKINGKMKSEESQMLSNGLLQRNVKWAITYFVFYYSRLLLCRLWIANDGCQSKCYGLDGGK